MKEKLNIQIYPKRVNGKLISYPPELGEYFVEILQRTASAMSIKAKKAMNKKD